MERQKRFDQTHGDCNAHASESIRYKCNKEAATQTQNQSEHDYARNGPDD